MSVILGPRQRPEPDMIVIRAEALGGPDVSAYQAGDVVPAVEELRLTVPFDIEIDLTEIERL